MCRSWLPNASTVIGTTWCAPRLSGIESRASAPSLRRKPGQGLWIDPMVPQPQHGDSDRVGAPGIGGLRPGGLVPRELTVALP